LSPSRGRRRLCRWQGCTRCGGCPCQRVVVDIPNGVAAWRVPDSALDGYQHFDGLGAVGEEGAEGGRGFDAEFLPGVEEAFEGILDVMEDFVGGAAFGDEAWDVGAGDGVGTVGVGFQLEADREQT